MPDAQDLAEETGGCITPPEPGDVLVLYRPDLSGLLTYLVIDLEQAMLRQMRTDRRFAFAYGGYACGGAGHQHEVVDRVAELVRQIEKRKWLIRN